MNRRIAIFFFLVWSVAFKAQTRYRFMWPIDSPRIITGNYGELRPNHFHDGLDFTTGGQINRQIYAAEEGYVSRIKVSATGYGKSVYITHPNGRVTVYAHLNSYSLKIGSLVKKEQLEKRMFEVELFPLPGAVSIRKGEIIGLSGNTGGSTGPHLHFEIRDEKTETPLNPLTFFRIRDHVAPTIQKIGFYDLADTCAPQFIRSVSLKYRGDLLQAEDTVVLGSSVIGFAFSGFDRYLVNGNPNNIFSVLLYLDGRLIYMHTLNGIDFADNRYINEFSEVLGGLKFQKCFLPTLYPAAMYANCLNKGRILLGDRKAHELRLVARDESDNEQYLQCYVRSNAPVAYRSRPTSGTAFVNCSAPFRYHESGLDLFIPERTLFYSCSLLIENTLAGNGRLLIGPSDANLRNSAIAGIKVPERFQGQGKKLVLKKGTTVYAPTLRNDSVFWELKSFGTFSLAKDTVAPRIKALITSKQAHNAGRLPSVSFIVEDAASGLAAYNLYLNNQWVIGEYDAKSDTVTYYFDDESPSGKLEFRMEAEDKCGNRAAQVITVRR